MSNYYKKLAKTIIASIFALTALSACNSGTHNTNANLINRNLSAKDDSQEHYPLTRICTVNGSIKNSHTYTLQSGGQNIKQQIYPGEINCHNINGQNGFKLISDYKNQSITYNYQGIVDPSFWDAFENTFLDLFAKAIMLSYLPVGDAIGVIGIATGILNPLNPFSNFSVYGAGLNILTNLDKDLPIWAQDLINSGIYITVFGPAGGWDNPFIWVTQTEKPDWIAIAHQLQDQTNDYVKSLSSDPSSIYGGGLVPGSSPTKNPNIFVLGLKGAAKDIGPGINPLQWEPQGSATGNPGDMGILTCEDLIGGGSNPNPWKFLNDTCKTTLVDFSLNKNGVIITSSLDRVDDTDQSASNIATITTDAIYICLTDDSNTNGTNCSYNDRAFPLNFTDPSVDNNGNPYSGTVAFTNNTQGYVIPILNLYKTSDPNEKPTTIAGGFVMPNGSYRFEESKIPTDTKFYEVGVDTSTYLANPNVFICSGKQSYNSNWAEQRVFANYNFASPLLSNMNQEGPYGCYFYDPASIQNPDNLIWQNFGVRAWQNIKMAKDLGTKKQLANKIVIQDWIPNWRNTSFSPINDLDLAADQLYYAFESMTAEGIVKSTDNWTDFVFQPDGSIGRGLVASLLALNKPFYLGIGGWNNANEFSEAISNNKISTIVSSTMGLINALNNDAAAMGVTQKIAGVNIDWEPNNGLWTIDNGSKYVVTKADLQNLLDLIDLFNQQNLQVNISIPQNISVYRSVDAIWGGSGKGSFWNILAQKTQTLNVMSYDYHAATWDGLDNQTGYTNFNSPLHNSPNQKIDESGIFTNYNIDSTLDYLIINDNISSSKLVLGIPAYGYAFPVNTGNYGAYIPFINDSAAIAGVTGLEVADSSLISYKAIYFNLLGGWNHQPYPVSFNIHNTSQFAIDPEAMEAYTQGATGKGFNIWTSFENSITAAAKAKYAKDKSLGGMMLWEVDQDLPAPIVNFKRSNPDSIISGLVNGQK